MTFRTFSPLALALAALALASLAGAASAEEASAPSVTVGWWTSAQIAGAPVGHATLVPEGGLQVANGSGGPISIAAVRFAVPPASDATLVLHLVAGSTPETASVVACPVTASWQPVRGAPLAEAPTWDCAIGTAAGDYDPVARTLTWSFDVSLVRGGWLDVMLLPVEAGLPFNVTTDAPGADAVRTASHPANAQAPGPASPRTTATTPDPAVPASFGASTMPTSFTSPGGAVGSAAPAVAPVGLPSPLPTIPPAIPALASGPPEGGDWVGIVLLVAAVGAGLALWRGLRLPWDRPLAEAPRGVGRFARPRTDLAARI